MLRSSMDFGILFIFLCFCFCFCFYSQAQTSSLSISTAALLHTPFFIDLYDLQINQNKNLIYRFEIKTKILFDFKPVNKK